MEVIGVTPEFAGLQCEALICEAFVHRGNVRATANVVHLRFAGIWHKLIIDGCVIFWRQSMEAPKPWSVDETGFEYPHTDVGKMAGVIGHGLKYCRMDDAPPGVSVTFSFENGRTVIIRNVDNRTAFQIT